MEQSWTRAAGQMIFNRSSWNLKRGYCMVLANATLTRARLPGPNNDMKLIETWWSPLHQNLPVSLCAVVG